MRTWVAKWNRKDKHRPHLGHVWSDFFCSSNTFDVEGHADGVGGKTLEPLSKGHLVVCYQTDTRSIAGVGVIKKLSKETDPPSICLRPLRPFPQQPTLSQLIAHDRELKHLSAFLPGSVKTFREVSILDFRRLMRASDEIAGWLDKDA